MESRNGVYEISKSELESLLEDSLGKTLKEADSKNLFLSEGADKDKGIPGKVIQYSVLGFPLDTKQDPDLSVDGQPTELKTTGLKRVTKDKVQHYEAKETVSITAVSIGKIEEQTFETSFFWHKIERILFVYYEYLYRNGSTKPVPISDYVNFPIRGYQFKSFTEEEIAILKHDWEAIRNYFRQANNNKTEKEKKELYVNAGDNLRGKLMVLNLAPKYKEKPKRNPRIRFNQDFMTNILEKHFGKSLQQKKANNKQQTTYQLPEVYSSYKEIDEKCHNLTNLYKGKTIKELANIFGLVGVNLENKAISEKIIIRMFDGKANKFSKIDLFNKIGLYAKSIVQTKSGNRTEDTKLFQIDFSEFNSNSESTSNEGYLFDLPMAAENTESYDVEDRFEESSFYEYFSQHQFLFICLEEPYKDAPLAENKFLGFKRLYFSEKFIQENVKKTWLEINDLITNNKLRIVKELDANGEEIKTPKTDIPKEAPNFPKSKDNIIFVRGSAGDASKKNEEVNGLKMIRQFIWIKGKDLVDLLSEIDFL